MNLADVVKLLTFLTNVQPIVGQAIIALTASLQGKSLEEIQADSDTIFDAVIARGRDELMRTPPDDAQALDRDADGVPDIHDPDPLDPKVP